MIKNTVIIQNKSGNCILMYFMLCSCLFFIAPVSSFSQTTGEEQNITKVLFILDGSRSMLSAWANSTKFYTAQQIIIGIADSLNNLPDVQTGLRIFGHQTQQSYNDCNDTKLEIPFKTANLKNIQNKLYEIIPKGVTPISYSMLESVQDFGPPDARNQNIVILITDAAESCGNNPCNVVNELRSKGIITRSYVIGLSINDEDYSKFECMGDFINVNSPYTIKNIVSLTLQKIFNSTAVRVDLLDQKQNATETDAVITLYDDESGKAKYNFYHTINPKGVPDTISINPSYNYNLQVHTNPEVWKKNISIKTFQFNVVQADAPQGYLKIAVRGESFKQKINCIVKKDANIIDVQNTGATGKYLVGDYDIDILTLPVITVQKANIKQNETTTIEIPAPGYVSFIKAGEIYGGIYLNDNNRLTEIFELTNNNLKETLALQPGKYSVIYRYKANKAMSATKEINFEIVTGTTITQKL